MANIERSHHREEAFINQGRHSWKEAYRRKKAGVNRILRSEANLQKVQECW